MINPREGEDWSFEKIMTLLTYNEPLIDGVVFTGGEPLVQVEPLIELCKLIKEEWPEWGIMLNTNGTDPQALYNIMKEGVIDRVAMDVKTQFGPYDYLEVTGDPSGWYKVLTSIKWVKHFDKELELRTTVVPTLVDSPFVFKQIAREIRYYSDEYHLQQGLMEDVLDPSLRGLEPVDMKTLEFIAEMMYLEGLRNIYIVSLEGIKSYDGSSDPSQ